MITSINTPVGVVSIDDLVVVRGRGVGQLRPAYGYVTKIGRKYIEVVLTQSLKRKGKIDASYQIVSAHGPKDFAPEHIRKEAWRPSTVIVAGEAFTVSKRDALKRRLTEIDAALAEPVEEGRDWLIRRKQLEAEREAVQANIRDGRGA